MTLKRSGQDASKDLYHEAVSSSRPASECGGGGGVIEVKCSGGDALYVSPAVLAAIMPWVKQDLLGAWPECSVVVPDMRKRSLEELLARLFNVSVAPPSKKSKLEIKETVECLRIPLDVESIEESSVIWNAALDPAVVVAVPPPSSSLLLSDDAASACLSDVDISSISDRTILENFSDQEARLVCLVCYKIFGPEEYSGFRSHVTNHKRSALSKVRLRQSHRCDRCEGAFDTKGQLDDHVAAKHEVRCEACGRVFSNLAALKSHERTHKARDLECERCGKGFQSSTLLATHLAKNICGTERRECVICRKVFSDAARMRIHARSHTGERPYKCDECGKAFAQSRSLKEHELTHRAKSFACELCDRAFAQPNHLRYHRAAIHGQAAADAPADGVGDVASCLACQTCGKMFPFAHQLKRHSKSHYGSRRREGTKTLC